MDGEEPGGEEVEEVVQAVGVRDAVDCGVEGGKEGQDIRYEACSVWKQSVDNSLECWIEGVITYRPVTLGVIFPALITSTNSTSGSTARRLWWVLNGVNQWTARLWIQTISTGMLMGNTQSMRTSIEVA